VKGPIKKILEDLIASEKCLQSADHLLYVSYPALEDTRLLLRSLESIYQGAIGTMSALLKLEHIYYGTRLSTKSKENLETFFTVCASRYALTEKDCTLLKKIFYFSKQHKLSPFEFPRKGKIVILDETGDAFEVTPALLASFLEVSKKLLLNTNKSVSLRKV